MRVPKIFLRLTILSVTAISSIVHAPAASSPSEHEETPATRVSLEIGKPLNLASYGGPHVELTIMGIDVGSISVKTLDFDHLTTAIVNNVATTQPTQKFFTVRRKIGFSGVKSLILTTDRLKVYFVDEMNTRQNHVVLEIVRQ